MAVSNHFMLTTTGALGAGRKLPYHCELVDQRDAGLSRNGPWRAHVAPETSAGPHVCVRDCMYAFMCECMCVCVHVCIHACMPACMHVCMYMCMYARRYAIMCTYMWYGCV